MIFKKFDAAERFIIERNEVNFFNKIRENRVEREYVYCFNKNNERHLLFVVSITVLYDGGVSMCIDV